jgi:hypothetical protein
MCSTTGQRAGGAKGVGASDRTLNPRLVRKVGAKGGWWWDCAGPVDDDVRVPSVPLAVLPDPDPSDAHAVQAWVEAIADGVALMLLVDTGTPRSAFPHVEPFASRVSRVVPGGRGVFGGPAEEALVTADVVVTGDQTTRQLLVQLQPRGWPHPALLGMDLLGSHRCNFRFDDPRIELDGPVPAEAEWVPLATDPHRTPTVKVDWGHAQSTAIWDTGAGVTLVDQSWAGSHPDIVAVGDEIGRGTDVTGAQASHPWGTLAACRIGGREFGEQVCGVVDFSAMNATLASPIEVVVGLPLIIQASWCMDFPGRRWVIWP